MEKFKFLAKDKINRLPRSPGVYAFKKGRKFLYIGKASNIRGRVKNHFAQHAYRDNLFIKQVQDIGYLKTSSEIEALILEADLIKKYQPKYNVIWRDDKNFFYIGITKKDFPRIFITHQIKNAELRTMNYEKFNVQRSEFSVQYIGPFVDGRALKQTLRFLRRIFPYYTVKKHPKKPCGHCHLGLCPGPNPDLEEYRKNINNLIGVLKGKRKSVLKNLKKEMNVASSLQDFERSAKIRNQIRALERIFAHTRLSQAHKRIMCFGLGGHTEIFKDGADSDWQKTQKILQGLFKTKRKISRIEAYDISNIQGQLATGSMVTFINGVTDKNFYRKFRIKVEDKPNDIAMLKEVLLRRLGHPEWPFPDLILIDGGKAQLNAAHSETKNKKSKIKNIQVMALAKRRNELYLESHKQPILLKTLPRPIFNLILQLRNEAHRFAITYHRKLRRKALIGY